MALLGLDARWLGVIVAGVLTLSWLNVRLLLGRQAALEQDVSTAAPSLQPTASAEERQGQAAPIGGAQASGALGAPAPAPRRSGDECHFTSPKPGFISGCAQSCKGFPSLEEAQAACLDDPTCGGLTSSGQSFQLRSQGRPIQPSRQGETSVAKQCVPATPSPSDFREHTVACNTTAGSFVITLEDSLSPMGVSRFLDLVDDSFFDDMIFYRVISGFLTQFGVAADPNVQKRWDDRRFPDEPKKATFQHGTVSYAGAGKDSRSCHVFIAFGPNGRSLGNAPHETPLGRVTEGLETLDRIQQNYKRAGYKDLTSLQGKIRTEGNRAAAGYPLLDRVHHCRHVSAGGG